MSRSVVKLVVLALVLIAALAFAGSAAAMPPLQFSSGISVQNLEDQLANIVISFYDIDGDGTPVEQIHDSIEPNGTAIFFTIERADLGYDWSGSAVVGADRDIRVLNTLYTEDWMYQAMSSGYLAGSTKVGLPVIQTSNNDWDTWFNVQNVGPDDVTFVVSFEPGVAGQSYTTPEVTLKPFTAHTFDQREMQANLTGPFSDPDGEAFIGAATVISSGPVVATVIEGNTNGLMAYDGFMDEGTTQILAAPLFHTNHGAVGTQVISGISIQNNGDEATDVTVQYVPSISVANSGVACYETRTIQPGSMGAFGLYAFHPAWGANSPLSNCYTNNGMSQFIGSAYVSANTASQPLVAMVQEFTQNMAYQSAYNASGPELAAAKLACPEIQDRNSGFWTGISLMNVGLDDEDITITYTGRDGNGNGSLVSVTQTFTLESMKVISILHGPGGFPLANGFVGAAIIEADDGDAALVAIVNKLGPQAGDALSTYNAFPLFD
jgi:hypothetical protein